MSHFVAQIAFESHPSLDGHFPGHPVMPGVVLLERVVLACKTWAPECQVSGLESVKFHRPIRPGDRFAIELQRDSSQRIRFRCAAGELLYSNGVLLLREPLREPLRDLSRDSA